MMLRFCASGTEATMYIQRLAKAFTGFFLTFFLKRKCIQNVSDLFLYIIPPLLILLINYIFIYLFNISIMKGKQKFLNLKELTMEQMILV